MRENDTVTDIPCNECMEEDGRHAKKWSSGSKRPRSSFRGMLRWLPGAHDPLSGMPQSHGSSSIFLCPPHTSYLATFPTAHPESKYGHHGFPKASHFDSDQGSSSSCTSGHPSLSFVRMPEPVCEKRSDAYVAARIEPSPCKIR